MGLRVVSGGFSEHLPCALAVDGQEFCGLSVETLLTLMLVQEADNKWKVSPAKLHLEYHMPTVQDG